MAPTHGMKTASTPPLDNRLSTLYAVARWHPNKRMQTRAGKRLIDAYQRDGKYTALRDLAYATGTYSEQIKTAAQEALVRTAWQAVNKTKAPDLEAIVRDKSLPDELHASAGNTLCEHYEKASRFDQMKALVLDKKVIEATQILAGVTLVDHYVKRGYYGELIDLKEVEVIREHIGEHFDEAVTNCIASCVADRDLNKLYEVATDRKLTAAHRAMAREKMPAVIDHALARDFQWYSSLQELQLNNARWLPRGVRARVRTAMNDYAEKELGKREGKDWYELEAMVSDSLLPKDLRKQAMQAYITERKAKGRTFSTIRNEILREHDEEPLFPRWLQAEGITYLLSRATKRWAQRTEDFLPIVEAESLPQSLRLRAAEIMFGLYAQKRDYASIERRFVQGEEEYDGIPVVIQRAAVKYLRQYAVAQAERVMTAK